MGNVTLGIFCGQTYATASGEEFTVVDVVPKGGYALVEDLEERQGVINLGDMLEAIQTGALVSIDEEGEDSDSEEE